MYQSEDKKKVQAHIFDIFKEVIHVCDMLEIPYFIMGGTALGAVRHGGFIPWDDDLDIGMLRKDYERFLKEAPRYLRSDLFLQTYFTEPDSPFYFAKVRKEQTEFVEYYCRKLTIHSGIYVDIFPYDAVPDKIRKRREYYRCCRYLLNLYIAKDVTETSVPYYGGKKLLYGFIRKSLHILMFPIPKKQLFRILDGYMQKYNLQETEYIGYGGNAKVQMRLSCVMPPAEICFEGITVKCPDHIEAYLQDNYGDYHILPPEKERKGHAPYRVRV